MTVLVRGRVYPSLNIRHFCLDGLRKWVAQKGKRGACLEAADLDYVALAAQCGLPTVEGQSSVSVYVDEMEQPTSRS